MVVATDGAVKDDGRMGAAYAFLDNRLLIRSFVVLPPPLIPESMRAVLSAMDEIVTDAPGDKDLTILADSQVTPSRPSKNSCVS